MDSLTVAALVAAGICFGAWAAIRECANAAQHGGRTWWMVAMFRAEQRIALRRFKHEREEIQSLERSLK